MQAILNSVSDPSDLLNVTDTATPYRFDRIFGGKGFGAKWLAKKRLKLMQEIDGQVRTLLAEGEKVEFVSWGIEYSLVEHYFMGIWAQLINRRALIFTNDRLLLVQINSRRKVKELRSQLRYQGIEKIARRKLSYISLVLRDGKKLHLTGIPRKDRKAIKALLTTRIEATRVHAPALGREHLCPYCGNRVMGFPERCKQCARSFKSGARAGWLSLALPGLGDIYLGHRGLGAMEILGALLAWGAVVLPLALGGDPESSSVSEAALLASFVFAFVHGGDSWITRRVGFKGIYPAGG